LYATEAVIEGNVGTLLMGSSQMFHVVRRGKIAFFRWWNIFRKYWIQFVFEM